MKEKKKLIRTENRITHNGTSREVNFRSRWTRHSKNGITPKMKRRINYHLDYTPLFKFLLSKEGEKWEDVWRDCQKRVDTVEPVLWMVQNILLNGLPKYDKSPEEYDKSFGYGEGSYFSTMYVDENGILQVVDKNYKEPTSLEYCRCCGETFNGLLYETYKRPKKKIEKMKTYIRSKKRGRDSN